MKIQRKISPPSKPKDFIEMCILDMLLVYISESTHNGLLLCVLLLTILLTFLCGQSVVSFGPNPFRRTMDHLENEGNKMFDD